MTTYMFPGQGSQVKGMGSALFDEFPDLVQKADQILGYSIQKLCLDDPDNLFNKTEYTQPALYVVSALSYIKQSKQIQMPPQFVAGHSLGEYNALFASGVVDFETGLSLVQKRGALMSQAIGGGMAAVIGLTAEQIESVLDETSLKNISIANYNSYKQIVITGPREQVIASEGNFIKAGAMIFVPLKVSGAFHSPYMKEAQAEFAEFIRGFTFLAPKITIIANVNAKPYQENDIRSNLINQITQPVQWTQSIEYLLKAGETTFQEIGPGKILAGLVTRIQKGQ